jgi:hypothetical protein
MTWILLTITLDHGTAGIIPYRDAMACGQALPSIHATLALEHPDVMLQCIDTGTARVRPKARPW